MPNQMQALSDGRVFGLHPLECGLTAELPISRRTDERARRVGRPLDDQSMGVPLSVTHRADGP